MVLIAALLSMSILVVGGVWWIPLAYMCTPIPSVVSILVSVSAAVATISVTLTSSVMTQPFTFFSLPTVSMASTSSLLFKPPSQVGTLESVAALVILILRVLFVPRPEVFQ